MIRKALVTIGGILVAVLGALFIIPALIDWNSYRGTLEEEVSRVIGRDVRVGGGVSLRLLPFPYVNFEKVRITDNAGVLGEPFFRADAFTMWLSVAPLLKGRVEAREIELRRPVVTLAVDAAGVGNWSDFKASQGSLPFVPAEVALQAVNIIDGTIQVQGPNQAEIIRAEKVYGELSADNIDGPYRFRGTAAWREHPREIRFATSKFEADGSLRIKGSVKAPDSGASYTLDGRLVDIKQRPRLEGEVSATIPSVLLSSTSQAGAAKPAKGSASAIDLRAKIASETTRAALSDINISFDSGGQPQFITGSADVAWIGGTRMRLLLSSLWLDLDKLAGTEPGEQPFDIVRTLVAALTGLLPEASQIESTFNVEQVSLGGEAVSGLKLSIARTGGPLQVNELRASLPGGTRLELNGAITQGPKGPSFLGDVGMRGASYARFMSWGAKGFAASDARSDGPFSLQGRLSLAEGGVEVSEVGAELLGTPLNGAIRYRWDAGRRQLALTMTGQKIDLAALLPSNVDIAAVRRRFWPAGGDATAPQGGKAGQEQPAAATKEMDLRLRLRAADLAIGDHTLRNVDADIALDAGRLTIPALRLTTPDSMTLELEGDVAAVATPTPRGSLRWVIDAADATALGSLADLMGVARQDLPPEATLAGVLPARVAGALTIGGRAASARDVSFDGLIKGRRVKGALKLDGGFDGWRSAMVDAAIDGEAADAGQVLQLVWPRATPRPQRGTAGQPGQFSLRAIGKPLDGMMSIAAVATQQASISYDGRITLPRNGVRNLDGIVKLAAKDLGQLLALTGVEPINQKLGAGIEGTAALTSGDGVVRLSPRSVKVGGAEVAGEISITPSATPVRVEASLGVTAATVPGLLAILLDPAGPGADKAAGDPADAGAAIWPVTPFDLGVLDDIAGKIRLRVGTLTLGPGVGIDNAALDLELSSGKLTVAKLEGKALGGAFSARANLEKAMAGAVLSGALRLDGAEMAKLVPTASGPLSFNLQFDGKALSPRALISVLAGQGEVSLGPGRIGRVAPAIVQATSEKLLDEKAEIAGEPLKNSLMRALAGSHMAIRAHKIAVKLADGVLKSDRTTIDTGNGRAIIDSVIDLAALKIDSEWRLQPKAADPKPAPPPPAPMQGMAADAKPPKGPLPAISLVYVGALGQLARIEPRLQYDALERELAVRRMERDVEELERLRRLDEERARLERERQLELERQQELERQRALEAQQQASPAGSAPPAGQTPAAAGQGVQPPPTPVPPTTPTGKGAQVAPAAAPQAALGVAAAPAGAQVPQPEAIAGATPPAATPPAPQQAQRPAKRPFKPFSDTGEPAFGR